MKYAIIKGGIVINIIEYSTPPTTPPPGFSRGHEAIRADNVSVGWIYANGTFSDPSYSAPDAEKLNEIFNQRLDAELNAIDMESIRSIREYIASKADAPQELIDAEIDAASKRLTRK